MSEDVFRQFMHFIEESVVKLSSDEQRLELAGLIMSEFCIYCGNNRQAVCHCRNDE